MLLWLLWKTDTQRGSLTGSRRERERAVQLLDTLLYETESQAMLRLALADMKTIAIVRNRERDLIWKREKREGHARGMRVPGSVRERLLADAQQGMLRLHVDLNRHNVRCHRHAKTRAVALCEFL